MRQVRWVMTRSSRVWMTAVLLSVIVASPGAQLLGSVSEEEEVAVGRQAAAAIEADLALLDDDAVANYIDGLGQAIAGRSGRPALTYTFKVVDSPEINAFALPGGFIYVNRGLIEAAENETELAGVLAHEVGHVVGRHGAEQLQRAAYANLGLQVLGSVFGRGTRGQLGTLAAEMATTGTFMRFSRDAEREADRLGVVNVAAAGYDPRGMLTFFERLDALAEREPNAVERFFASHPSPAERVTNIQDLVGSLRADRDLSTGDDDRFSATKRRLAALPAAVPPAAAASTDGADRDATAPAPLLSAADARTDAAIAERYAPVFRQALGTSPRYDLIARFDFDGDWVGDNNWDNAADERLELGGAAYYSVSETGTHYFIHYAVFHPRDYKGGNVGGVLLSEIMREGAERHGDYDPTGLAASAVLAHENDMEGALVVAEKRRGRVGLRGDARPQPVSAVRRRRRRGIRHRTGGRRSSGALHRAAGARHRGLGRDRGADERAPCRVPGRPRRVARTAVGTRRLESADYALVSMLDDLWPRARAGASATYGDTFDYADWAIVGGEDEPIEVTLGPLGSRFRGAVGGRDMARPPWGWFDLDETDRRQGEWFLDPAGTTKRHFGLGGDFATSYVYHPILGVTRAR